MKFIYIYIAVFLFPYLFAQAILPGQKSAISSLATAVGFSTDDLNYYLLEKYGVELDELSRSQGAKVIKAFQSPQTPQKPNKDLEFFRKYHTNTYEIGSHSGSLEIKLALVKEMKKWISKFPDDGTFRKIKKKLSSINDLSSEKKVDKVLKSSLLKIWPYFYIPDQYGESVDIKRLTKKSLFMIFETFYNKQGGVNPRAEAEKIRKKEEEEEENWRREERIRWAEKERIAKEKRLTEEKRLAEAKRLAEEKRLVEAKRLTEEKRIAEAKRLAEEKRLAEAKILVKKKRIDKPKIDCLEGIEFGGIFENTIIHNDTLYCNFYADYLSNAEGCTKSILRNTFYAAECFPEKKKIIINFGVRYTDRYGNKNQKIEIGKFEPNMEELRKYQDEWHYEIVELQGEGVPIYYAITATGFK